MTSCNICNNLENVFKNIKKAAQKAKRNPGEVKLIAVSKTVPPEIISDAVDAGVDIFGENYVQEAKAKIDRLKDKNISWHFIGHLQKNKGKNAVELFDMIHSLDSFPLARKLNEYAKIKEKKTEVLIQVNIAGEPGKSGLREEEVQGFIEKITVLDSLKLKGLMVIPPYSPNPENSRPYYNALKKLLSKINRLKILDSSLSELSMGMSNDYVIAIEEGATMVRVGTVIFGSRIYRV
ncbi:MAG: YggS family pyridoxal phosphate-dependent enzyme [Thermodesulfobacteriota bacterium]|nr:YggS family pyridoxal phosphate-dependent enzyme [Thermodesulfobacteriota bacterium]